MNSRLKEGSVFFVPLRNGGYARGIIARLDPRGEILFGFFFGPKLEIPKEFHVHRLERKEAILCLRFGALGLTSGKWMIHGMMSEWRREEWGAPDFVRRDPLGRKSAIRVRYSDSDPSIRVDEHEIQDDGSLQEDVLSGYGAVELRLTKLLDS